jgi:hypothetical protein
MRKKAKPPSDGAEASGSTFAKVLKWAGAITALLSLVFGLQQFLQLISETRERRRNTTELYEVGKLQQSSADYAAAWATFEQGLLAAEPGGQLAKLTGQLDKERRQFRAAQEDLAMEWLRNLRINGEQGGSFSNAVAPITPVLTRGIASAQGARKANLLAHLGWANFLRYREGQQQLNPEPQYREALVADSTNPYAHAYLGHWLLWTRRATALPTARAHFAAAARSPDGDRAAIRTLQLSAFLNLNDAGEPDFVRAVSEMRGNNEPVADEMGSRLRSIYVSTCRVYWRGSDDDGRGAAIRTAVPAEQHLANLQQLTEDDVSTSEAATRDACRATLLEALGYARDAGRLWQSVRPATHPDAIWSEYGVAAVGRLARTP